MLARETGAGRWRGSPVDATGRACPPWVIAGAPAMARMPTVGGDFCRAVVFWLPNDRVVDPAPTLLSQDRRQEMRGADDTGLSKITAGRRGDRRPASRRTGLGVGRDSGISGRISWRGQDIGLATLGSSACLGRSTIYQCKSPLEPS